MKSLFQAGGSGRLLFWQIILCIPVGLVMAKWLPYGMIPYLIVNILIYMWVAGSEEDRINDIKRDIRESGKEPIEYTGYEGETYDRFKGWEEVPVEDMPEENK